MKKYLTAFFFLFLLPTINHAQNYALDFDGVDDYVNIPSESDFDFTGSMTVELWIKSTAASSLNLWEAFVTKGDTAWRIHRQPGTDRVNFAVNYNSGVSYYNVTSTDDAAGKILSDSNWHHIAGVFDRSGNKLLIYIDGVYNNEVSTSSSITINNSTHKVAIGENLEATGRYFKGQIDEVRIWNDVRTQAEITANMNTELTGSEPNLVAYYQFNETSGTVAAEGVNNYDGTLVNMTDADWVPSTVFDFSWDGSTDTDWNTAANWSSNSVPTNVNNLTIPTGLSNYPTIASGTSAASKTIAMASGTSLVASGTATLSGDITYTRGSLGTDWHLVSSPVVGETIQDVITNSSLATGTGSNIGLSTYNNSTPAWEYYTSSSTGTMASGAGYAIKVTSGDTSFTGTIPTADVSATTTDGSNGWNLIGNPYPSYIAVNNNADASNRLMGSVADFDSSYAAIYFWDAATSAYIAENNTTNARFVAPGQGFFVKVNSGVSSIAITEAMQSHQSSEEFSRTVDTSPKVILTAADGNVVKTTTLKYFDTTNTGLDIGYDAGAFNGGAESAFKLNTHLVSDSQGIEFTLQALSTEGYETSIVPVALTAAAGKEISFSAATANLPAGMMVFLEDRQVDVFTRLDEAGSNYMTTLASAEAGIGRFYVHTSVENRLGVATVDFTNVNIYATDSNTLRITGLTATTANIQIFDVLGRQLLNQRFEAVRVNDIAVPNLVKANVYLVKVSSATGSITKKVLFHN